MHCDVHYYPAKFVIKIQLVYAEKKDKGVNYYSLWGYPDFSYN